ncbi:MAG: type II secretion system protein GspJ [Legionellales bacterium RIFCSPHIGHO2_12_FULL_35_11]|nr:MAG: type II secretion system protein GspJ [Legionellales bacterium RIFCSPHIGHO2_12_FULL_35_11]
MNNRGFTLIEIIVALAVFAIIAAITSSILYQSFQIKERTENQSKLINQLQLGLILINKDISQIVERPVRGNQMHLFPSFIGQTDYLEFTRGGNTNYLSTQKKSNLGRIAYICKNKKLLRRTWSELDTPDRDNYHDRIIFNNLINCSISYIGMHQNIVPTWYQYATRQNDLNTTSPLPKAIKFDLNFTNLGEIKLDFKI